MARKKKSAPKAKPETRTQYIAFAAEYVIDFNATQAAIRAGYSVKTAYSQGSRLLKNVEVQAEIERHMQLRKMKADEVLVRLAEHGRADMADFADINEATGEWSLNLGKAKRAGKTHLIKKLKPGKYGTEIELHSVDTALTLLGKHHKLFTERIEVVDWEAQAIADIQSGKLTFQMLVQLFDRSKAERLFALAGIEVTVGSDE